MSGDDQGAHVRQMYKIRFTGNAAKRNCLRLIEYAQFAFIVDWIVRFVTSVDRSIHVFGAASLAEEVSEEMGGAIRSLNKYASAVFFVYHIMRALFAYYSFRTAEDVVIKPTRTRARIMWGLCCCCR